jgi:hypothetical protein
VSISESPMHALFFSFFPLYLVTIMGKFLFLNFYFFFFISL